MADLSKINLMNKRKIWYIIALIVIIPCIASLFINGLNLGIDFTGGNLMDINFSEKVTEDEIRDVLVEYDLQKSTIQMGDDNSAIIRTGFLSQDDSSAIIKSMEEAFGEINIQRNESVGPVIGQELSRQAFIAIIIAVVLMVAYITFRFEFFYGISAIAALMFDTMVTLGAFSVLQIEIGTSFVAAVLTVIGYSINDTIVIFDRIRENWDLRHKGAIYCEVVNKSIFQTLARSINTLLAVLFVLFALFFLGGETTRTFVLAMIIGTVTGGFTSIFLASSLAVDLGALLSKENKKKRKTATKNMAKATIENNNDSALAITEAKIDAGGNGASAEADKLQLTVEPAQGRVKADFEFEETEDKTDAVNQTTGLLEQSKPEQGQQAMNNKNTNKNKPKSKNKSKNKAKHKGKNRK